MKSETVVDLTLWVATLGAFGRIVHAHHPTTPERLPAPARTTQVPSYPRVMKQQRPVYSSPSS